jgi:nucleotide-binding universal stress UspA family protein
VRQGIALARSLGARITVITVSPSFHTFAFDPGMITDTPQEYQRKCEALAAKTLGVAEAAAKAASVPFRALHVVHDHPYAAIIEAAQKGQCDLIFMASHGRKGVSALVLGSETTKVLTHTSAGVPVRTVTEDYMGTPDSRPIASPSSGPREGRYSTGWSFEDRRAERERMVAKQIEARGIHDPLVLHAMRRVPREAFVPTGQAEFVYDDAPIPIG